MISSKVTKEEYAMASALLISKRSKDPNKKVGAVIVDKKDRIIAQGYNGFPKIENGNNDLFFSWEKDKKKLYVIHAEQNCINNGERNDYFDCVMYCTLFPCNKCSQAIVLAGIKEVVFLEEKEENEVYLASKKILSSSNINYRKYTITNPLLDYLYKY